MRSFLVIALLLVTVAISVQADTYHECPSNLTSFTSLLEHTRPIECSLYLNVDTTRNKLTADVTTKVKFGKKPDPEQNVIVLNVNSSISIYSVSIAPLSTKIVCRNSKDDTLVIQILDQINDGDVVEVCISNGVPIRSDKKGFHMDGDVLKASFAQTEARLVFPSFNAPGYEAVIKNKVEMDPKFDASSDVARIKNIAVKDSRKIVTFKPTAPMSLNKYTFELHPAKQTRLSMRNN